jgi:hypothetical protein
MKCQFYATYLLNKRLNFEVHLRVMCTNDAYEQFFFYSKGLNFARNYSHTSRQYQ